MYQQSEGNLWQTFHRLQQWSQIWKTLPNCRPQIENVNHATSAIFNFTSSTRGCFPNLTSLVSSMDPFVKKLSPYGSMYIKYPITIHHNYFVCFVCLIVKSFFLLWNITDGIPPGVRGVRLGIVSSSCDMRWSGGTGCWAGCWTGITL